MSHLVFLSADTSNISRFTVDLLPQQTLMELFVEHSGIDLWLVKHRSNDTFLDISMWPGVIVNSDGDVICIDFNRSISKDSIELRTLPQTLTKLRFATHQFSDVSKSELQLDQMPRELVDCNFSAGRFTGSVSTSTFSPVLVRLNLSKNNFMGTVNFSNLPSTMEHLNLSENDFEGSVDLLLLPQELRVLIIHCNRFSGPLYTQKLPPSMRELIIRNNHLEGTINLECFPAQEKKDYPKDAHSLLSMAISFENNAIADIDWKSAHDSIERVDANCNFLHGLLHLEKLPRYLQVLRVSHNEYTGTPDLSLLPPKMRWLEACHNKLSGCLKLVHLPNTMRVLSLSNNEFDGSLSLEKLPQQLRHLDLSNNLIKGPIRLRMIPKHLKSISLANNQIVQKVVQCSSIPKSSHIDLTGNSIGTVKINANSHRIWIDARSEEKT